jgi:hypothetical protein
MLELSYFTAALAALVLLAAAVAWFKIVRNPKNDLTLGGGGKPATKRVKRASRLIAVAVGLCGLAAFLAVAGWFIRL